MVKNLNLLSLSLLRSPIVFVTAIAVLIGLAAPAQAQKTPPNLLVGVEKQSGSCPDSIGLWVLPLSVVGAVEYTVVPNTLQFADAGKFKLADSDKSDKKVATFSAPLNELYASCVGQAESKSDKKKLVRYAFQFKDRKVYFRVELTPDDSNTDFATYTRITYATIVTGRPYLIWRETDQQP